MDASFREAQPQFGVLSGLLLSDPRMRVSLELSGDEVIAFSRGGQQRVAIVPTERLSPPGVGPTGDLSFTINGVVDGWAHLLVESPVGPAWEALATERRTAFRSVNANRTPQEARDSIVADASSEAKQVWYVLPPPMDDFDLGVSIADIGWQTGMNDAAIFDALNELDRRGILGYNAEGKPRRRASGQSG